MNRSPVGAQEPLDGKEGAALVPIWKRVVPTQVLDQHRSFLDQPRIRVLVAEASARSCKGRVGQRNARQPSNLLRGRSKHLSCNSAVIAERDVEDFGHLSSGSYCAKRRSVSSCFFIAARRSRRCSSGVPGSPDFMSGFLGPFLVVTLGACGFIAGTLLHPRSAPPRIERRLPESNWCKRLCRPVHMPIFRFLERVCPSVGQ